MIHLLLPDFGVCEVYRVGDESGWNSGTGTNFLSWSQKYNFTVGDVLGLISYSLNKLLLLLLNIHTQNHSLTVSIIVDATQTQCLSNRCDLQIVQPQRRCNCHLREWQRRHQAYRRKEVQFHL